MSLVCKKQSFWSKQSHQCLEVLKLEPSIPKATSHHQVRANPQTMCALGIRTQSLTLRPASPTVCVANQELCSHWHIHHKTSLKYCPLGSHLPQAAQESSASKIVFVLPLTKSPMDSHMQSERNPLPAFFFLNRYFRCSVDMPLIY